MTSIAQEQKQINDVLIASKKRLEVVDNKIELLGSEKESITEDIQILTHRLEIIRGSIKAKEKAYEQIDEFCEQADLSIRKLHESTEALLYAFKKEEKKIDDTIKLSRQFQ